ncbi:MAG: MMPL family transporter [Oscillospiraceae bacterium]
MDALTRLVLRHRVAVISVVGVLTVMCAVLFFGVRVNYDLTAYLPEDSDSTVALDVMDREFSAAVPNARVMVPDVSLEEALDYKTRISAVPGVTDIMWLNDMLDLRTPIEAAPPEAVEQYYKDGSALFQVTIAEGDEKDATAAIYDIIGETGAITGNAMSIANSQNLIVREVLGAMAILLPIIVLLLILTTTSWVAPLLFLLTIGVAVIINLGSNIFLPDISFITQAVSPILQLAVSLDYAIFLLNSFERFRQETDDAHEAMRLAVKQSFASIAASAVTTLFGFLALMFMRFGIGSDLGLNLVKGVILSYAAVMIFLPALALCSVKLLDKTTHKRLIPEFRNIGHGLLKIRVPALLLVLLIVGPCFLAQSRANFLYGNGLPDPAIRYGADTERINDLFGESTAVVLLVPKGDTGRERELCADLGELDRVTGVMSYVTTVGSAIPDGYLDSEITSNFYSENYTRIIVNTDTAEEGDGAFETVAAIRSAAAGYYDECWTCGQSANLSDIKTVITGDSGKVNFIAIIFIFLTLLVTFRSLTLPVILLFVIESAIWINLSVPYFADKPLVYMGYLVMNTVQLGATIDYAILMTDGYKRNRLTMGKREAVVGTLGENFISVLTSALILSSAGFCLNFESSVEVVSELGMLLARGTLLSLTLVLIVLPGLLLLFDRLTGKLTLKANFYKEEVTTK